MGGPLHNIVDGVEVLFGCRDKLHEPGLLFTVLGIVLSKDSGWTHVIIRLDLFYLSPVAHKRLLMCAACHTLYGLRCGYRSAMASFLGHARIQNAMVQCRATSRFLWWSPETFRCPPPPFPTLSSSLQIGVETRIYYSASRCC